MKRENILENITSAINYLEESMKALVEKNQKEVIRSVWRASADLEHALFLFSLMHQDENPSASWKLSPSAKQFEVGPTLVEAQDLLKEAKDSFEAQNFHEAHKKAWMARGYLLRVHDFFEKMWRKEGKTSS
ncbi:MAG: hypothetical protein AOA66_0296 [Candidatus Bathyarchaeota archaeon BA2]|nr:MAG: hypothetical protein AOA66_0296 [Candidatus Bathyarchaeota archaeon BA2]